MIKIFFNNSVLILSENKIKNFSNAKILKYSEENTKIIIKNILDYKDGSEFVYYGEKIDFLFRRIKDNFTYTIASGGIVRNSFEEYLFIYKRNIWDLPKGKVDEGETVEIAAIREVSEECGLEFERLEIISFLESIYHIYMEKNKYYLKCTYWFNIEYTGYKHPKPQKEEGITDIRWINPKKLNEVLNNSYKSIIELFNYFSLSL